MSEPYREVHWQGQDGLRLYSRVYEAEQAGAATVLCLHGLSRNSRDFEDLALHLRQRYRVIVPDLRGRGLSARDPRPQNYQPATYVRDVIALLDTVGALRVSVIGTSLGGMMAMMMGAGHRGRLSGAVLNDVGPEIDPVGIERIKHYAGKLPPVRTWDEAAAQTRMVYETAWPNFTEDRWRVLARRGYREDKSGTVQVDADPMIGEALRAAPASALDLWPLWQALRDLPMLAIRGAHSDILSAATFARMKKEKPDLEQLIVAERGHVPLLDERVCLAAIDSFLARLP